MTYWKFTLTSGYVESSCHCLYDLLARKSIVICPESNSNMVKNGDVFALVDGDTIIALAEVFEKPYPIDDENNLQAELEKHGINHANEFHVAKARIWKLEGYDQIRYCNKNRFGRISKRDLIDKINNLRLKYGFLENYVSDD